MGRWMVRVLRGAYLGPLVALLLLAAVRPAQAQWPTVMMFHGGPLKQPVFVEGADSAAFADVFRGMGPGADRPTAASMGSRPYIAIACFWGTPADPAVNGVTSRADLKPDMAWQHARFYPATRNQPAMLFVMGFSKQIKSREGPRGVPVPTDARVFAAGGPVSPAGLAVLTRKGIPIE